MVHTLEDPMPYSQLADMVMHLDALGVTNYQVVTLPGNAHSFANWPAIKGRALAFLARVFAGVPPPPPVLGSSAKKLLNVSTRADTGLGENVMVGGFIVSGDSGKRVVLRALGPSLSQVGVSGTLSDPMISLYDSSGTLIESNDNRLVLDGIVNPLLPLNPSEAFLTAILPPGSYTAIVEGVNASSGVALVEVYDLDDPSVDGELANISTRGLVGTDANVLIGGVIVGPPGGDDASVVIRAIGPALAFATWRSLAREQELGDREAALLMTRLVAAARVGS